MLHRDDGTGVGVGRLQDGRLPLQLFNIFRVSQSILELYAQ